MWDLITRWPRCIVSYHYTWVKNHSRTADSAFPCIRILQAMPTEWRVCWFRYQCRSRLYSLSLLSSCIPLYMWTWIFQRCIWSSMAPTAAMLLLSDHPHSHHHIKPSFDSDLPPLPPPVTSFLGVQVSPLKWVSGLRTGIVCKARADSDHHGRDGRCLVNDETSEALIEKRFEEALRLSCW